MIKYKLSEIAKNLNVTSKEVSEVLKNYLNVNKKSGGVLTEQELNVIFEYYTDKTSMPNLNAYYASANEPAEEPVKEETPKKQEKKDEQVSLLLKIILSCSIMVVRWFFFFDACMKSRTILVFRPFYQTSFDHDNG